MKVTKAKALSILLYRFGYKGSADERHATSICRTPAATGNRADAKRGEDGDVAKQRPYCSWAPCEPSRSAGLCRARVSALQQLTSGGCSSAAAAGRVASSARPAKTEHRRAVAPRATGEQGALSFAFFSLGKQRKEGRLSGRHPDAPARSRKNEQRDSGTNAIRLRYLSPSGWCCALLSPSGWRCALLSSRAGCGVRKRYKKAKRLIPCAPLSSPTTPEA
jgi:hypothetical protein